MSAANAKMIRLCGHNFYQANLGQQFVCKHLANVLQATTSELFHGNLSFEFRCTLKGVSFRKMVTKMFIPQMTWFPISIMGHGSMTYFVIRDEIAKRFVKFSVDEQRFRWSSDCCHGFNQHGDIVSKMSHPGSLYEHHVFSQCPPVTYVAPSW